MLVPPPLLLNSDHQNHKSTQVRTPRCSPWLAHHSRHHRHANPSLSALQLLLGGCGHTTMEAGIPVPPPSLGERRTHTHRGSQTPEPELTTPTSVLYHFGEDNHSVAGAAAASPGATAAVCLGAMASPTPIFVEWGRETE
jgi:hypothetical protein